MSSVCHAVADEHDGHHDELEPQEDDHAPEESPVAHAVTIVCSSVHHSRQPAHTFKNSVRCVIRPASYWSIAHSANARASTREQRQWIMAQAMQCSENFPDTAITSVADAEVCERSAVGGDVNTFGCDVQRMVSYEVEQFVVSLNGN